MQVVDNACSAYGASGCITKNTPSNMLKGLVSISFAFMVSALLYSQAEAKPVMPIVPTQEPAILNLNFCRPVYPRESMRRGEQGTVQLEFTIGVNGRLVGSRIAKSSGFRELDMAALNALIHCSFAPAYLDNKPVQALFTMEYQWVLGE